VPASVGFKFSVAHAPQLLDAELRRPGAIDHDESVNWKSPIASEGFIEYRGGAVLSNR